MCKILTVRFDRKTGEVIKRELRDSNETIDYSALADAYLEKYLRSVEEGQKIETES